MIVVSECPSKYIFGGELSRGGGHHQSRSYGRVVYSKRILLLLSLEHNVNIQRRARSDLTSRTVGAPVQNTHKNESNTVQCLEKTHSPLGEAGLW